MGASPQQKALDAAKKSIAEAQKQQRKMYRDIKSNVRKYSQKTKGQLDTLQGAAGTTLPDYISAVKQQLGNIPTLESTQQKYEQALSSFDPNLIRSTSNQRLRQSLLQSAQRYAQDIENVAGGVSGRLYKTMDAPKTVFQDLAASAATNLQLDPMAMMLATKPKTVRSDVGSMQDLYTYNI